MKSEYEQWADEIIGKQPAFESEKEALDAADYATLNKKGAYAAWKEPDKLGGRYIVAEMVAWEAMYRRGYRKIDDTGQRNIDRIEEM